MNWQLCNFHLELAARPPGIVCLAGGGGKTTLLFSLCQAMAQTGERIICTTTTRMAKPVSDHPLPAVLENDPARIVLPDSGALFAARPAPPDGDAAKVYGYAPADIDALAERFPGGWLLVEADGAAGRPIKAPADHEPVIPSRAAAVVAVVGLSCLNRPFGPDIAHRPERVAAVTGLRPGDRITPAALAALATHPEGMFKNCPSGAARILFCNQADAPGAVEGGEELAGLLAGRAGGPDSFYLGSLRRDGLECRKCVSVEKPRLAALVLAAGGGSRLGGGKLLLEWRGRPLVGHVLDAAGRITEFLSITVVLGHEAEAVGDAIRRGCRRERPPVRLVENPEWRLGQSTSLRRGLAAVMEVPDSARADAVMILLGDQPLIRSETLRLLVAAHAGAVRRDPLHPATRPTYAGQPGNPVILSSALVPELMALEGDVGARKVLAGLGERVLLLPVDDPGVVRDIDTPEEYLRLSTQTPEP